MENYQNDSENSQQISASKSSDTDMSKQKSSSSTNSNESTSVAKKRKAGRPKGSKNTSTLLKEALENNSYELVAKEWEKVVKTTITKAQEGDPACLKILWDRVVPSRKASDSSDRPSGGGITIVVEGAKVQQNDLIEDAEIIEEDNG